MSSNIAVHVQVADIQSFGRLPVRKLAKKIIEYENGECGNLNIIFCDDKELLSINQQYLGHDTLTDIITFDYCQDFGNISGDIFISVERVKDNAASFGISWPEELCRVVAHGVLHLLGYNDNTEEEILEMRKKENHYLNLLYSDVRKI